MAIATALVSGLVTFFAIVLGKNLVCEQCKDGSTIIKQDGKEIARLPSLNAPFAYTRVLAKRTSSTLTAQPTEPQVKLKNPLDINTRIFRISLIPDVNFKTKGACKVKINQRTFLDLAAADLTDIDALNIDLNDGQIFEKGEFIEISIWNGVDALAVALTVVIIVGEYL